MRTTSLHSRCGLVSVVAALAGCSPSPDAEPTAASPAAESAELGDTRAAEKPKPEPRAVLPTPADRVPRPELGELAEVPLPLAELGHPCDWDAECQSGSCSDGVCCDVPCGGACEACDNSGKLGLCSPLPAGAGPDPECGAPACYDGIAESFWCDGAGGCQLSQENCGEYQCGGTACLRECRSDADCIATARCRNARCESQ